MSVLRYLESTEVEIYSVGASGNSLDDCAIELGVYFVMLSLCFLIIMDQVRGKPRNIGRWLMFREIEVLGEGKVNNKKFQRYLYLAVWFYMLMPLVVLFGWFLLMLYDRVQEDKPVWGPLCILMAGSSFLLFGYNACRVKWTNFRVKTINIICLFVCIFLLTCYQGIVIFGYESSEKFFPYSAFFLNINVTIISVLVYFSKYQDVQDIGYIVTKFFPLANKELDRNREVNLNDEIEKNLTDKEW
jgi:hypothetical protein